VPRLSIWFIRVALADLALGVTFGALLLANKGVPFDPAVWRLRAAHIELLLIGWLVQLAMGVAFWILPRFWAKPARGNTTGAYLAFALLNAGVWTIVLNAIGTFSAIVFVAGRVLEITAAASFALYISTRIISREGER
jgi:hypothetical protein